VLFAASAIATESATLSALGSSAACIHTHMCINTGAAYAAPQKCTHTSVYTQDQLALLHTNVYTHVYTHRSSLRCSTEMYIKEWRAYGGPGHKHEVTFASIITHPRPLVLHAENVWHDNINFFDNMRCCV